MPYVKYVGPYDEVDIPDARLQCKRNQTIEVSSQLASSLLEQTDNWTKTTATKSAQTAEEED